MELDNLTLEEKSYIYGLLLTDGSLYLKNAETCSGNIALELNDKDEDIIDKLCSLIKYSTKTKRTRETNFKTDYHAVSFHVSRKEFIKWLIEFGFPTTDKTINARPPIVEYDKNAFWRGVIDGDGSLGIRKGTRRPEEAFLSLTTQSEYLKNAFCEYMNGITGIKYNPKRNKRDNIYNIGCAGHSACKILDAMYMNNTICLNRKYNKYLDCINWCNKNNPLRRNTSGVVGVCYIKKCNKWWAQMTVNNKKLKLGMYDDKNDAIRARLLAEFENYGNSAPQKHLFEQYKINEVVKSETVLCE